MDVAQAFEIAVAAAVLVVLIALFVEVRRSRRASEAVLAAIEASSDRRREELDALLLKATGVLRAALDEGQPRAVVFDPPVGNDTSNGPEGGDR
jgi:ABC-type protease/lipase transport system fused ATPase/permease subunit